MKIQWNHINLNPVNNHKILRVLKQIRIQHDLKLKEEIAIQNL